MQVQNLSPQETAKELEYLAAKYEGWEAQLMLYAAEVVNDLLINVEELEDQVEDLTKQVDKLENDIVKLENEVNVLENELAETNAALDALVDEVLEEL